MCSKYIPARTIRPGNDWKFWYRNVDLRLGKSLFTATDRRITAPGKVALWTKADSLTHFAELTAEALP